MQKDIRTSRQSGLAASKMGNSSIMDTKILIRGSSTSPETINLRILPMYQHYPSLCWKKDIPWMN